MFVINNKIKSISSIMMLIGLIALVYGFINDPHAAWPSLLFNNYFFLGISLFAVVFVALQYISEAGWSIVLKRVPEAIMSFLPITGVIMLIIVIAGSMHWNHIYHWMETGIMDPTSDNYDAIIAGKEPYLNVPFFLIRSFIYVIVWVYCAKKLKDLSLAGDLEGGLGTKSYNKGVTVSAWFIVFFAVTSCTASWDWIMSIDTHWFSTLFGWYIFSEWATIGFATILLLTLYLKKQGYLENVNENHIHDLGKFVFAFSIVWTYMWFSQFMLIWYANIPEEVVYHMERIELSNYRFLFWFSLTINFIIPLILLMSRDAKRNTKTLTLVCVVILIGHWINSYLLFAPGTLHDHGHLGFVEIGMGIGFLGLFLRVVMKNLRDRELNIKSHPFLDESRHLHH
ncbi:MAG: quinol:cytochrome C oxidoreductase [Bacteroidota bacterium]|nr:quinol:cytochrome C oxidoreductase [Bacteroidota bacterium]